MLKGIKLFAIIFAAAAIFVLTACSQLSTPNEQGSESPTEPSNAQSTKPPAETTTEPPTEPSGSATAEPSEPTDSSSKLDWNDADAVVERVMGSGAFSETLFELPDANMGFDYYALDAENYVAARFYFSPGSTAEEFVYLKATDKAALNAAKDAAETRMAGQIPSAEDYFPAEVPKLEHAKILTDYDNLVVLVCVADDYAAFEKAVE